MAFVEFKDVYKTYKMGEVSINAVDGVNFCIEKGDKGGKKLQETAGKGLFIALLLFVGIPLPGTGAWTGTLAASFLDMDFKSSVIAVMLGVMLAGVIMGLASAGVFGAISALIL